MEPERRYFELRAADDGGRQLSGVAVRYGDVAELPFGRERIVAGAFTPIGDVILNASHMRSVPLARTGGGGLDLLDTDKTLSVRATLAATRAADDVMALVNGGVMRGLSIEFMSVEESMDGDVRVINRAVLTGVAVVDTPAYPASEVQARQADRDARNQPPPESLPRLEWWR